MNLKKIFIFMTFVFEFSAVGLLQGSRSSRDVFSPIKNDHEVNYFRAVEGLEVVNKLILWPERFEKEKVALLLVDSKNLIEESAKSGHPGACEIMAQLSAGEEDALKWRLRGVSEGCANGFVGLLSMHDQYLNGETLIGNGFYKEKVKNIDLEELAVISLFVKVACLKTVKFERKAEEEGFFPTRKQMDAFNSLWKRNYRFLGKSEAGRSQLFPPYFSNLVSIAKDTKLVKQYGLRDGGWNVYNFRDVIEKDLLLHGSHRNEKGKFIDKESVSRAYASLLDGGIEKSARCGDVSAQYFLGRTLLSHAAIEKKSDVKVSDENRKKGLFWIKMAANNGHPGACELMAQFSENYASTWMWRRRALASGCQTSLYFVRKAYADANMDISMTDERPIRKEMGGAEDLAYYAWLDLLGQIRFNGEINFNPDVLLDRRSPPLYLEFDTILKVLDGKKDITKILKQAKERAMRSIYSADGFYSRGEYFPPIFIYDKARCSFEARLNYFDVYYLQDDELKDEETEVFDMVVFEKQ